MRPEYHEGIHCDCGGMAELVDAADAGLLFRGRVWLCECGKWAKAYDNSPTAKPMGRLADAELHRLHREARTKFDFLWQAKRDADMALGNRRSGSVRRQAYEWLAKELGITVEACNINFFDKEMCKRVLQVYANNVPEFMR